MTTIATRDGGVTQVGDAALGELALRGGVLRPGDDGYDAARSVWNAMIDRRPGLIARCAGAADVIAAVRFAREHDLLVSVRGGGHSVAGSAVCDGGLMIDLSPMRSVRVDPERRRAQVEPGVKIRELDHETQAHGLATSMGVISDTGVAGLTLGGGFGVLSRKHGLAIDNLVSADVVTADGQLRHASESEHPDLFWALRGGGGNFGIVTRFELQLHPVGPTVFGGLIAYPLEQAAKVLRGVAGFVGELPEDLNAPQQTLLGMAAPPMPFLPEEVHGTDIVGLVVFWSGDLEKGETATQPLLELGDPVGHLLAPMPYTAFQQMGDPIMVPPARNYWTSRCLTDLSDGVIDVLAEQAQATPSPASQIIVHLLGGTVARVPAHATAYPHRDALFEVNVQARWDDPAHDDRHIDWARDVADELAPHTTGGRYVNTLSGDEPDAATAAYGANHRRLADIKRTYDPTNLFRLNHNIAPEG